MYSADGPTTVLTLGDSTTTPEPIETQPDADPFFFPWEDGPDYPDGTPLSFPPFDNSDPPVGLMACLNDQANNSITFFDVMTDNFINDSQGWVDYSDMTDSVVTVLDNLDDLFSTANGGHIHEIWCAATDGGWTSVPTFGWVYAYPEPCSCGGGIHTPQAAPTSMPTYAQAQGYYDAVAELREKLAAVWYNYWKEVNEYDGSIDYIEVVNNRLEDRLWLVQQDFAFDVAAEWFSP